MEELTPVTSSSSSSSFASRWTYDVFLSFRGEDTRYGFTGNLYRALSHRGICTFIDNRLERGEEITCALFKTIEESRIAIIIFSANYASSTFCLEELVKILECMEQNRGLVWPIFYKVDPSDVRHLQGSYGEAITGHYTKFKNDSKLQRWKWALHEAANLSGWHFEEGDGYEYEFVEKIVEEVSNRINPRLLQSTNYPNGLKSRVEVVISLLHLKSINEVISVGIHGIGGIGKTTIACEVYNAIVDQFQCVCFLSNVRERSKRLGLMELQETLIFELIGERITIKDVRKGILIIKRTLCQKKVLLILDDVNSQEQLEALAGGIDWFGMGSRIILTTRNKHLLDVYGVSGNYEVEELYFEDALELFSRNAFKKNKVDSSYASISECVVCYCNGLPLALEIISSNLFNKTQEEWKSALETYKNIPAKNIQSVLEVSYQELEEIEKEIFLDIACFFNGYYLDVVKNILLNGRGYDPQYSIGVLVTKSLIKIDQGQVKIHDLIAQMGREIIRSQSPSNPGNWNRLWSYKHILDVLQEDKGTDRIEALVLKTPQDKKVRWDGKAFKKMTNLKILIIGSAQFSCGPKYLPNSLRVLEWKNYSSSALPSHYDPRKLAILNLCASSFRLTKPLKNFESLTELVLRNCPFLKQVPDISGALSLRKINVNNCPNLVQVHDSVGFHDKLALLDVSGCSNLRIFPRSIKSASFQSLDISGCFRLQSVPEISGVIKNKLATSYLHWYRYSHESGRLSLINWGDHVRFDCGILMLPKLENWMDEFQHSDKCRGDDQEKASPALTATIRIYARNHFREKGRFFPTLTNRYFSAWRPYFSQLTELHLQSSDLTDEFLYQRLPWFPHLHHLDLSYNKFTILPECMNKYHHLYNLILNGCKDLREIKGIPPNIGDLMVVDCTSLTVQSSEKLLSQAFHEGGARHVIVPGFRIPKWLDHHCMGSSMSFWCRNEFPKLALCFVHVLSDIPVHIFINGIEVSDFIPRFMWIEHYSKSSTTPCISLLNFCKWGKKSKIVLKEDEWNHVQCSHNGKDIYSMGVLIYNKEIGMDNIRFIEPHPLKRICAINHNLSSTTCLSLQNKFCPFQDMQVCESVISWKLDNVDSSTKSSKKMDATEKTIGIMQAPTKVKMLMWRILNDPESLPTGCNLFKQKHVKSPMCLICETEFETVEHVFLECPWTRPLWFGIDFGWIMNDKWVSAEGMKYWLIQKFHDIKKVHPNAQSVTGLVGSICWVIWKARNEFILTDKPVDPLEALITAKAMHVEYFSDLYLEELTMAEALMKAKASIGTTHPGIGKAKQFENKVKQKGKFVISSNVEMKPTYDKGIEAENKAKRKRGESNSNTEMEPNCDKENVKGTKVNYRGKQRGKIVSNNNIDQMEPTCDKDNVKSAEVDYKVKPKRKIVSSSNAEKEHTFDKGTQVKNKAKRKKEEESSNIEVEPNCHKVEKEEELKLLNDEVNNMFPKKKKVPLGTRKRKYNRKSESKTSSNQLSDKTAKRTHKKTTAVRRKTLSYEPSSNNFSEPSNKQDEAVVQPFATIMQEPIVEIDQSQENESLDKETFVNENTPKKDLITNQTIVDAEIEISYGSHSTSKVLEEQIHALPKLNIFDTTIGSDDLTRETVMMILFQSLPYFFLWMKKFQLLNQPNPEIKTSLLKWKTKEDPQLRKLC